MTKQPQKMVIIKRYCWTLLGVTLVTAVGEIITPFFSVTTVALLYLLPVLLTAVYWGRGFSWLASFLGVLAFDVFFVPPYLSLTVADIKDLFTFGILLLVGLITGTVATRLREELERTKEKEKKLIALYDLSQQIAAKADLKEILQTFAKTVSELAEGQASLIELKTDGQGLREVAAFPSTNVVMSDKEKAVVHWVLEHGQSAGKGTETLREASEMVFPVRAENGTLAALVIHLAGEQKNLSMEQTQLVEAFANLAAVATIRVRLSRQAEQAQWLAESEKLHHALLDSISHDLRTPLASIMSAVTGLLVEESVYDRATTKILLEAIKGGARNLNRLVANLLDMVSMESGTLKLNKEWCDLQDMVSVVLKQLEDAIQGRSISVHIPPDFPAVMADFALIVQVLVNLIENAAKRSPANAPISVSARLADKVMLITVQDQGTVIPMHERERVFEKFYRSRDSAHEGVAGLDLAVCKGIVETHGGMIWLESATENGNRFTFSLPLSS